MQNHQLIRDGRSWVRQRNSNQRVTTPGTQPKRRRDTWLPITALSFLLLAASGSARAANEPTPAPAGGATGATGGSGATGGTGATGAAPAPASPAPATPPPGSASPGSPSSPTP